MEPQHDPNQLNPDAPRPVAYDQYGNPLYAHPPPPPPQHVHFSRAINPTPEQVPPEVVQRHAESLKKYPHINLSNGEFILSAVRRHPVGLLKIWAIGLGLIVTFMAMYFLLFGPGAPSEQQEMSVVALSVIAVMIVLTIAGTFVGTYVYQANRFYLTNESVIQEIQTSLISKHEQTVSLANIEDASYEQKGIFPLLLNYGRIRLSTEGEETTYRFNYVANPKKQIAILNNAVEAFKNGRPVGLPNDD
jgi:hypothetical protein